MACTSKFRIARLVTRCCCRRFKVVAALPFVLAAGETGVSRRGDRREPAGRSFAFVMTACAPGSLRLLPSAKYSQRIRPSCSTAGSARRARMPKSTSALAPCSEFGFLSSGADADQQLPRSKPLVWRSVAIASAFGSARPP